MATSQSRSYPVSLFFLLLTACASPTDATFDQAANAVFDDILDEPFTLMNGRYEGKPFVENGSSKPIVQINQEHYATGDLNADGFDEMVVTLVTNFGGSGAYVYLAVIKSTEKGARSVATIELGDRVQVRSLAINADTVVVETTEHGPDDAMCCPTMRRSSEWNPGTGTVTEVAATDKIAKLRGQIVMGHEARSFTECASGREAWLIDETGGDLGEVYRSLAIEPYQSMFFELLGSWTETPDAGIAAEFSEAIRITEVRRAEREGFGCKEDPAAWAFSARGNEPSWRLDVGESELTFTSMGNEPAIFSAGHFESTSSGVTITAKSTDSDIELTLVAMRCTDSMSGSVFPYTATVKLDEKNLQGCAAEGARH